jgi:hypothetical protein
MSIYCLWLFVFSRAPLKKLKSRGYPSLQNNQTDTYVYTSQKTGAIRGQVEDCFCETPTAVKIVGKFLLDRGERTPNAFPFIQTHDRRIPPRATFSLIDVRDDVRDDDAGPRDRPRCERSSRHGTSTRDARPRVPRSSSPTFLRRANFARVCEPANQRLVTRPFR